MTLQILERQLDELNHRLRVLILQNVREEDGYDEDFLYEMNQITKQILGLKQLLNKHMEPAEVIPADFLRLSVTKH